MEGNEARGASKQTVLKMGQIRRLLELRGVEQEMMPWRARPDGWCMLFFGKHRDELPSSWELAEVHGSMLLTHL